MGLFNDILKGKYGSEEKKVQDVELPQKEKQEAPEVIAETELAEETQVVEEVQVAEEVVADDKPSQGNLTTNDLENIVNQLGDAIQHDLYATIDERIQETMSELTHKLGAMKNEFNLNLQSVKDGLTKVVEQQEITIQKQHNAALKFQEDVIYKTQKNLIMELISISDNIRMILHNKEMDPEYDLEAGLKELEQWVDASLKNNSIRRYQDTDIDNKTLNRKRQELVDREETDVPSEDGSYRTVSPGYVWSVPYLVINSDIQLEKILKENDAPRTFSYVIRPEEVVKLKYNKKLNIKE